SPVLDEDSLHPLLPGDVINILHGEGIEVEPIRGGVIGADRLRVVVDDNGVNAHLPERLGGVNRTVVELDPLADADRTRTEDEDAAVGSGRFHLVLPLP